MKKLVFIIGYGGAAFPLVAKAAGEECKTLGLECVASTDATAPQYRQFIASADAIFIYSHQIPDDVIEAIKAAKGRGAIVISASDAYFDLVSAPPQLVLEARRYFITGGEDNFKALARLLAKAVGINVEVPPLREIPWMGIYHPRLGTFTSLEEYLKVYNIWNRDGVVGILFYRTYWLYGNTAHINALVEALEAENLAVVPVFTYGFRDESIGAPSAEDAIREFLFYRGERVVDAVVNLLFFFLLDRGRWHRRADRFKIAETGVALLKRLNVPIITPITSSYKSVKEWTEDPQGVDYMTQVYHVIMPEVDGLIEPIFYAGAKLARDGTKKYEPFLEHAKYVAKRVKRWIKTARKPPSQRKIAIVLINPPCKNLLANIGVGFGLDVPESVVRLLHRLADLGYDVGPRDSLPKTGKELIALFLTRKAFSDFRFASVENIVKSGGAAAFVDYDMYMKWFEELPKEARQKLEKDWGHPRDVLEGRVPKEFVGMVYEGKFVVPGLLFGNVFITPQPKFGCAGPRCDGKVCRILHDPTITPPHQWLAVYRWITRVFGADVIIHFGTHGYLEFRPGKGVGLAPWDWPEISVDEVPHLYVYAVSNPMEGVIAKRRSYAVLIDHMYPPMALAEGLEELERLVNDYAKYKAVGEFEKAKITYEEIIKKAKDAHIKIPEGGDPEEVVEEVHRHIDMVRGTQINLGLHVFGSSPEDPERLAQYAAAVLAYDSARSASIRRVLAEYLGLGYDEMRRKPLEVNKLGMTNAETLDILHKAAVEVIKQLISLPRSEEAIIHVVESVLQKLPGGEPRFQTMR